MTTAKRRARRIAADEAHAWARNLRLRNISAKSVLTSLTLYVDGDGHCFVGIPSLAEDCEMSADTIRRRLAWLEDIGAIARQPQWIDEAGVRNGEGRGRRTTDKIRLLLDADADAIEARAAGRASDEEKQASPSTSDPSKLRWSDGAVDPRNLPGSDPRLGLGLPSADPSNTCEGLISEPEPEPDSPLAPEGGEESGAALESEPDDFAPAWSAWPGREVSFRRDLALEEFRKLSLEQQRHCRWAILPFSQAWTKAGRSMPPPAFHLWIRARGFTEFPYQPNAEPAVVTSGPFDETSEAGRAITALYAVAKVRPFVSNGRLVYRGGVTPQILAFAAVADKASWRWITDRQQIAAWQTFLAAHVHAGRPALLEKRGEETGFYAPGPWPPRKDGGWPDMAAA